MKIYIAGAGGMLGDAFYKGFSSDHTLNCSDKDQCEPWLQLLDFRDAKEYHRVVKRFSPDYLFHLGALTSLEYCERNQDEAYETNTIAVQTACSIANDLNIPLLYVSTAGIFDGGKHEYDDWDAPNPLSVYGRTKYLGERIVLENCEKYIVCRAGWMMGGGPDKDKKFVNKIMNQIKSGVKELNVVDDKLGVPTYTKDFATSIVRHLEEDLPYGFLQKLDVVSK